MLRGVSLLLLALFLLTPSFSYAKDDLLTVTEQSERVPLASGKSVWVKSICPKKTILIGGGGECLGFLNTQHKVVLTKSAPDSVGAAWNVECTNMNPEAGEAQAKAWAICKEH